MPIRTRLPIIVHHKASLDGHGAFPNSLQAVDACLSACAQVIEIDATALADGDYLLVHDYRLESETTGYGLVSACTELSARELKVRSPFGSGDRVALLSDVVSLMVAHGGLSRLQVDLKSVLPFADDEPLRRLIRIITPLGDRVTVSSIADWQLRKLRILAPELPLGLDIQFYLDWRPTAEGDDLDSYPHHRGAYGFLDDHPLSLRHIWATADYLRDRCAVLLGLVPHVQSFYVRHQMLLQSLEGGFNWAAALHQAGVQLDAWTLDADTPNIDAIVRTLIAEGVDMITTNTPVALAARIRSLVSESGRLNDTGS